MRAIALAASFGRSGYNTSRMVKSADTNVLSTAKDDARGPVSESREIALAAQVNSPEFNRPEHLEQRLNFLEHAYHTQAQRIQWLENKAKAQIPAGPWSRLKEWSHWRAVLRCIEVGGLLTTLILAYSALKQQSLANKLVSTQILDAQKATVEQLKIAREQNDKVQVQIDESKKQFESNNRGSELQLELARNQLREMQREFDVGYRATMAELSVAAEQNRLTRDQFHIAYRATLVGTLYNRKETCHEMERGTDGRCPVLADIHSREVALMSLIDIERARKGHTANVCLDQVDLRNARLATKDLRYVQLRHAFLGGANLKSSNLSEADLSGANLFQANLRTTNLTDAILRGADFLGTSLEGTNLAGADLRGAKNLSPEHIAKAFVDKRTRLP